MWWTLFALCVLAGLLTESYRRWRAVTNLWALVARFRSAAAEDAAAEDGAAEDAARRSQVAELNEATIELGSGLALAGLVPRSCAKASLSIGALVALIQSAGLLRGGPELSWLAPAISMVGGCVGAFGCACIGRAAEAEARRLRGEWGALIRRSSRDVAS